MDYDVKMAVYKSFSDEFMTDSFMSHVEGANLFELLIIYKYKIGVNYSFNDTPMKIFDATNYSSDDIREAGIQDAYNAIVIGGMPIDEDALDELTTGFINNSVGATEDSQMYQIYSIPERAIIQITKKEYRTPYTSILGYSTRQMFMSLITKLLPWHFADLSEEQMQVVREIAITIIGENGVQKINDMFDDVIRTSGIIEQIEQEKLDKIGERILSRRSDNIRNELSMKTDTYQNYYENIMNLATEIRELKIQLSAIENSQSEFENPIKELRQFMSESPFDYSLDHVSDETIYLAYRVPLTSYSTDEEYESMIVNGSSSSMFIRRFDDYDVEVVKRAYKHIIEDKDCVVWTCGLIDINMYRYDVHVSTQAKREHAMRHPHLNDDISCFGTASTTIIGYLKQARLFEAMNAIAYSTQQFTLYDSYAADIFLDGIESKQCIECPDGQYRTFRELMDAIEREEL